MKLNEIKAGEIFCMGGSKIYPKLKLDVGCVDIRDEIVRRDEAHKRSLDCELMSEGAVAEEFREYGMTIDDVNDLKRELGVKFN